jgi:adenylate cyclase
LLFDPILPAAVSLAVFAVSTPLLLLWTDRERQFINSAFSRYLSPNLVGRLAANPSALKLGGELRELTMLFSDIRDFTSISEQLAPDELTSLLNNFLTPATDALLRSEATIDKYIGDAIVAFWNAPLDIEDHPRKACRGALRMLEVLAELNQASGRQLKIGIGLNSAICCVGNFGSAQRFSYSAIGDGMNVASRIESLTKQYRVPILVTQATRSAAADFAFIEADLVRVVGHAEPIAVFALLGDEAQAMSADFRGFRDLHNQFLAAYRRLEFDRAEAAAAFAQAAAPEAVRGLYDVYLSRLAAMRLDPPAPGWDGVFTALSK